MVRISSQEEEVWERAEIKLGESAMADLDSTIILSLISVASLVATISWSTLTFYLVYLRGGRIRISSPSMAMQYVDTPQKNIHITFPLIFTNIGVKLGIIEGLSLNFDRPEETITCDWEFTLDTMRLDGERLPAEPFSVNGKSSVFMRCEFVSQSPFGELKRGLYFVTLLALVRHKWQICTRFMLRVADPTEVLKNTRKQQLIEPVAIYAVKF